MPSLAFAKLVATPTDPSWSQAYNAGNLFVCLSVSKKEDSEESLHDIGKELLNSLEAEFFTLEEKNLDSIKHAISTSIKEYPSSIGVNLTLAYFKEKLLYIFIAGSGKAIMKRGDEIGTLLEKEDHDHKKIVTASGFLQNGDIIILQTHQFSKNVPHEKVSEALNISLPSDIAEILSPHMHEHEDGGQAAIIISYNEGARAEELVPSPVINDLIDEEESIDLSGNVAEDEEKTLGEKLVEEINEEKKDIPDIELDMEDTKTVEEPITAVAPELQITRQRKSLFANLPLPFLKGKGTGFKLNHKRKLILNVVIIITLLLTASVVMSKNRQEQERVQAMFEEVYTPALKNYEDGVELKSINQAFARESFIKSQDLIKNNIGKFKEGSPEEKQLTELLSKVDAELGGGASARPVEAKAVSVENNSYLFVAKAEEDALAFAQDENSVYFVTDEQVVSVSKNTGAREDIIENDGDWENAVGISAYQGNIYVLDRENGIIKYVAGADGFGKNSYFSGSTPNLSNSTDLAIDGSIFILLSNGTLLKYTAGVSDNLRVSGLDKAMKNPIKVATDLNTNSVYVLDKGNSRIVKLSKDGVFEDQYQASVIRDAEDFEIREADGKILIFSQDKFFEISL